MTELQKMYHRARGRWSKNAGKEEQRKADFHAVREKKAFTPHMMYDPKTGKGYKAEKEADHLRMKKMGYDFKGIYNIWEKNINLFEGDSRKNIEETIAFNDINNPELEKIIGEKPANRLREELELIEEVYPAFSIDEYLAGDLQPVFFGSALNNFGVKELLDCFIEIAPSPQPKKAEERLVDSKEKTLAGFVFKIHANMDPKHRDRIAFVRVVSGHFERGMRLKVVRSGKELRPNTVVSFLSQRRELLEEAYGGDIIGIPNHGVLQLGDTLTEGEELQFTGLPFFAPEMIRTVEVADPLRTKQLRAGLTQLGEEGAIQVFRPIAGSVLLLGAVGQLQFEVVAHRLQTEYGVKARIGNSSYSVARWVTCAPEDGGEVELKRFIQANAHRIALDAVDAPTLLVDHSATLRAVEANFPKIKFHAMREHAGLVFQSSL